MFKWIHQIWNPHCTECALEASSKKVCSSCEVLIAQLAIANIEKKQLLEAILEPHKRAEPSAVPQVDMKELRAKTATWNVRRQMLEAEDRRTAALLRNKVNVQNQVDKLEIELGITPEITNAKPLRNSNEKDIQPNINEEVG